MGKGNSAGSSTARHPNRLHRRFSSRESLSLARLNANLDPRVAVGEHGWWQGCTELGASAYGPFGPTGANFNLVSSSTVRDPGSGTASHRSTLCEIRLADL